MPPVTVKRARADRQADLVPSRAAGASDFESIRRATNWRSGVNRSRRAYRAEWSRARTRLAPAQARRQAPSQAHQIAQAELACAPLLTEQPVRCFMTGAEIAFAFLVVERLFHAVRSCRQGPHPGAARVADQLRRAAGRASLSSGSSSVFRPDQCTMKPLQRMASSPPRARSSSATFFLSAALGRRASSPRFPTPCSGAPRANQLASRKSLGASAGRPRPAG